MREFVKQIMENQNFRVRLHTQWGDGIEAAVHVMDIGPDDKGARLQKLSVKLRKAGLPFVLNTKITHEQLKQLPRVLQNELKGVKGSLFVTTTTGGIFLPFGEEFKRPTTEEELKARILHQTLRASGAKEKRIRLGTTIGRKGP